LFLVIVITGSTRAQNYNGYFGLKNMIGVQTELYPNYFTGIRLGTSLAVNYNRVVGKLNEIGFNTGYSFPIKSIDISYSAVFGSFEWKHFSYKRSGAIAPVGRYFGIEIQSQYAFLNSINVNTSYNPEKYNAYLLFPSLKFGKRRFNKKDFLFDFSLKITLPPLVYSTEDTADIYLTFIPSHIVTFSFAGGKIL